MRGPHATDLVAAANEDRSSYLYIDVPSDLDGMAAYVDRLRADRVVGKGLPFVVYDLLTSRIVGVTTYLNIEWGLNPDDSRRSYAANFLEIGRTWLAASAQRTHVNTESKLLLLAYAFEGLGVSRVSFHTDEDDTRARVAVLRLGAWFEGVRRGQEIGADGTMRNSAYFSITAVEWPAIHDVLLERLNRL